jgi:hypothetical protein
MQEGPWSAAMAWSLILMTHDAILSSAMVKGRDDMQQHLAKQMCRPKQMHGKNAHPPSHAPEARIQPQDAPMIDMSMQVLLLRRLRNRKTRHRRCVAFNYHVPANLLVCDGGELIGSIVLVLSSN